MRLKHIVLLVGFLSCTNADLCEYVGSEGFFKWSCPATCCGIEQCYSSDVDCCSLGNPAKLCSAGKTCCGDGCCAAGSTCCGDGCCPAGTTCCNRKQCCREGARCDFFNDCVGTSGTDSSSDNGGGSSDDGGGGSGAVVGGVLGGIGALFLLVVIVVVIVFVSKKSDGGAVGQPGAFGTPYPGAGGYNAPATPVQPRNYGGYGQYGYGNYGPY
eukprot:TRINITY_DN77828_c0_g1_i1.p1 TRINITY_DN77828_c0_g1~~TRINITY_DN77828_c0_g1_i1.p1  ORF type:complete len:213 (-),score=8.46 TRINITY_DN77828_c0_g1_i1:177-815(-)